MAELVDAVGLKPAAAPAACEFDSHPGHGSSALSTPLEVWPPATTVAVDGPYEYPYPSPELAAAHPFVEYAFERHSDEEMAERARAFRKESERRRSIRLFSPAPVPRALVEEAVLAASTAPSGAHKQPWTFAGTRDPAVKAAIRAAAEEEERINYLENRMNDEWLEALAPLGTDHH